MNITKENEEVKKHIDKLKKDGVLKGLKNNIFFKLVNK